MEVVLNANPWLANYTGTLPAGLEIVLPEIETKPTKDVVRIWS
jgi:phage tail protein X